MEKINTDPLQSTHVKNSGKTFQYAQNRDVTHLRIESFLRRLAKQINETEWFVSGSPLYLSKAGLLVAQKRLKEKKLTI